MIVNKKVNHFFIMPVVFIATNEKFKVENLIFF
jgi:hypothetical protein